MDYKPQTWAACGRLAARSKSVCAGLSLRPIGWTPALSVTQSATAAAVCGAIEVMVFMAMENKKDPHSIRSAQLIVNVARVRLAPQLRG